MRKTLALLAVPALLVLGGCAETYTYEADPTDGKANDPRTVNCVQVEADASSGDDNDVAMGTFCKNLGEQADD